MINLKTFINSKRSQHEIAGFVLIVLVVSVIGVIFLSLMIGRGEPYKESSLEISNLLESSMYYTTDCAVNYIPQYRDGQDLVKSCYNEKIGNYLNCLDGRNVCDALETTMRDIIESCLKVGPGAPNKAYKLNIYHTSATNIDSDGEILILKNGVFANCSSRLGGNHIIDTSFMSSGTIHIELEVCRN